MSGHGIADPFEISKHHAAMDWVQRLVIDLKLQLGGHKPQEPITVERLNEWTRKHFDDLSRCREETGVF